MLACVWGLLLKMKRKKIEKNFLLFSLLSNSFFVVVVAVSRVRSSLFGQTNEQTDRQSKKANTTTGRCFCCGVPCACELGTGGAPSDVASVKLIGTPSDGPTGWLAGS